MVVFEQPYIVETVNTEQISTLIIDEFWMDTARKKKKKKKRQEYDVTIYVRAAHNVSTACVSWTAGQSRRAAQAQAWCSFL